MSSSWKFTKKLKETHLSSLTSFSRSTPSTSGSPTAQPGDGASPSGFNAEQTTTSLNQASAKTLKPGLLIITLYEARGLSLPDQYQHAFSSQDLGRPHSSSIRGLKGISPNHGRVSAKYMPYALVDFEKVQIFVNSVEGNPENPFWAGSNTQYKFDVSRVSEVTVHLFIQNPNAAPGSGRSQDIFLGAVRLHPSFDHGQSRGFRGVGWFDIQHGTGKIQLGVDYMEIQQQKLSIDDFELLTVIGKGSFGKVMQVRKKDTNRIYALKTIRKTKIVSRSEVTHTMAERSVLAQINNPFIASLKFSFQSPEKLYFVLAFVNGGELFHHLTLERRFDVNRSRFYTAELLCVLECLHGFNVIYRDLKPENILLDYQGHIALCDFGLCKLEMKDEDQTRTFCGTPEYLAPEILLGVGYNKTVDWWTLGVLLYEMLTGLPPFYDEVVNEMYRKILTQPLSFPGSSIVPPAAKDLLTRLLDRDPKQRLGANGVAEIKSHPFFHGIDWRKLLERKYDPSFKPNVTSASDTEKFDRIFTSEAPDDSFVDEPALSQTIQDQFRGFSYIRPVAGLNDAGGSIKDPMFMDISEDR